ncbi:crystal protein-like [Styela clava]
MAKIFYVLIGLCMWYEVNSTFISSFSNIVNYVVTDGKFVFNTKSLLDESLLNNEIREKYNDISQGEITITTTSGQVIGSILDEAHAFFSVPYAAPPVGKLRFRNTEPVLKSLNPINATIPNRLNCRQLPHTECEAGHCIILQDEDCLVLNVFVPKTVDLSSQNPGTNLPVLLWIHGGAFFSGTGTSPKTDGRWLSQATNTIVVTINYRLGAYGFLVYNKGSDYLNGNQGLKDQQMAMQWVQQNIENFGGDKDRVTIFGESAGAQSVMWHMLSEVSRPLYRRAILESNAAIFPHQTQQEAMDVTERLLKQLNCSADDVAIEFACLSNAPVEELDNFPKVMAASAIDGDGWSAIEPYRPIIDGVEFTDQPLTLFQTGKWNVDREYIVGANTEEVEILQYYVPGDQGLSRFAFRKINTLFFGNEVGQKTADYYEELIGPDGDDYSKILGIEAGDAFFICPSRAMSRFAYKTADNPSGLYFYMFDHPIDGKYCHEVYPKNETCGYVYHSAEIPFVFRSGDGYYFNENDTLVADQFSKYWGNFARMGDPNNDDEGPSFPEIPYWPAYVMSPDKEDWMNIHIEPPSPFVEARYKEDICDFWDSLNFYVTFPESTGTATQPFSNTSLATHKVTTIKDEINTTSSASRLTFFNVYVLICAYKCINQWV